MHRPATLTLRVSPVIRRPGASSRRPVLTAVVIATSAALGLTACSTQSTAQTNVPYQPADGVNASLGQVEARGLVLVASAQGAPGVLVGSLINTSSNPVTVTFLSGAQAQAGTTSGPTIRLPGGRQEPISGVQLADLPAPPGALTDVVMQTTAGQASVAVPIMLPQGYYASVTTTAAPNVSTPTTGPPTSASVTLPVVTETTTTGSATPAPPTSPPTSG